MVTELENVIAKFSVENDICKLQFVQPAMINDKFSVYCPATSIYIEGIADLLKLRNFLNIAIEGATLKNA